MWVTPTFNGAIRLQVRPSMSLLEGTGTSKNLLILRIRWMWATAPESCQGAPEIHGKLPTVKQ